MVFKRWLRGRSSDKYRSLQLSLLKRKEPEQLRILSNMLVKNRPFPLCVLFLILVQSTFGDRVEMKINLGGEAVDGFVAEHEVLDVDESVPKMRYRGEIKGSGDDLNIFKTQRFARGEDLVLDIPVPDGVYTVTLLFAETWDGAYAPGKRVFDVSSEFIPVLCNKICVPSDIL